MESILFRLFVFISVIILITSAVNYSKNEYMSYNLLKESKNFEIKLADKIKSCKELKNKSAAQYLIENNAIIVMPPEPDIDDESYIDWYLAGHNCEDEIKENFIEIKVQELKSNAIYFLKSGVLLSLIIMIFYYSIRWIVSGKINPLIPTTKKHNK